MARERQPARGGRDSGGSREPRSLPRAADTGLHANNDVSGDGDQSRNGRRGANAPFLQAPRRGGSKRGEIRAHPALCSLTPTLVLAAFLLDRGVSRLIGSLPSSVG